MSLRLGMVEISAKCELKERNEEICPRTDFMNVGNKAVLRALGSLIEETNNFLIKLF